MKVSEFSLPATETWSVPGVARGEVVLTPEVLSVVRRAEMYLSLNIPVHLAGPPGVGKTTLALLLAHRRSRPVFLVHGDEALGTAELVGAPVSYRRRLVVDEFIRNVRKREELVSERWVPNRLAVACRTGATVVYDEFTRSRPEAHSVLLPVLEERVLPLATSRDEVTLMPVHEDFRLILTSDPGESVGSHAVQRALLDRVVTLWLPGYGLEELAVIVARRCGMEPEAARRLVEAVRGRLEQGRLGAFGSLLRRSLMAARVVAAEGLPMDPQDARFRQLLADVVGVPGGHLRLGPTLAARPADHEGD